jgi:hypothetical protein
MSYKNAITKKKIKMKKMKKKRTINMVSNKVIIYTRRGTVAIKWDLGNIPSTNVLLGRNFKIVGKLLNGCRKII